MCLVKPLKRFYYKAGMSSSFRCPSTPPEEYPGYIPPRDEYLLDAEGKIMIWLD